MKTLRPLEMSLLLLRREIPALTPLGSLVHEIHASLGQGYVSPLHQSGALHSVQRIVSNKGFVKL